LHFYEFYGEDKHFGRAYSKYFCHIAYFLHISCNFSGGQQREIGTRLNLPSPGIYFNT
jgi:hypothetical protein